MKEISQEDIGRRIRTENPWWDGNHTISQSHREMKPRPYINLFYPLLKTRVRRAIVLMGPRRVGKTVMIHHVIQKLLDEGVQPESICYFSIDNPIYNGLGMDKLLDCYGKSSGVDYNSKEIYIFFDEVQYLRDWEVHLKSVVDTHANIRFTASGSAAAA